MVMEELQNCVKISNNIYFTWVSLSLFFFTFLPFPNDPPLIPTILWKVIAVRGSATWGFFLSMQMGQSICYSTYGVCISRKPFFILILFVAYMHNCILRIFHDKFNYLIQWNHEKNFLEWQVGSLRCENDYSIALLVVTGLL